MCLTGTTAHASFCSLLAGPSLKVYLLSLAKVNEMPVFSSGSVFGSVIYSYVTFREKDPPSAQGATTNSDGKQQNSNV